MPNDLQQVPPAVETFLGGKVTKQSLTVVHGSPGPGAPLLKRLLLPQGELAQVYDSEAGIRYLAPVELRKGGVRGNHYHMVKEEWVYVIAGELVLVVEDIGSKERATFTLKAGDLAFVCTGIAHALEPAEAGYALEFSTTRFNPADIHPYRLD